MCMCEKSTINGQPGYSWDGKQIGIRPPAPPATQPDDKVLYDEPGRCGGLDCHSHHFVVVKNHGQLYLLVRHGGGDERIPMTCVAVVAYDHGAMSMLDSNARFWMLHTIYSIQSDAATEARRKERTRWMKAASEKRIKTRKSKGHVQVSIVE